MIYHRREEIFFNRGYRIDKCGQLFNPQGIKVAGSINNDGYRSTGGKFEGKKKHILFHRFVAYCKFGDKLYNKDMVVRHLDGNKLNNSWDNIAIGTSQENSMDKPQEMRIRVSSNANKRHSDKKVEDIIKCHNEGLPYSEIMKKFGITSKGTLSFIINKRLKKS